MRRAPALDPLPAALASWSREAFDGTTDWYGALSAMVSPLSAREAIWQPAPGRRCIWEITRHITFWRHYVVERLSGRTPPSIRTGSWSMPDVTDAAAWQADLERTRAVQDQVAAWVGSLSGEHLFARSEEKTGLFMWILGLFCHDAYHTGQIAYLRALMGLPPVD